jgi:ABC-type sugar transport system permease subunit
MPALVMASLWTSTGFNMIYFLAGLQAVDKDLYEAAMVDGAGQWHQFWNVTWPSIMPVTTFVLVTATIGSLQLFELPWILFNQGAGPDNSGLTMVMYLFVNGFVNGDLGYASAVGWTLAMIIMVFGVAQVWLTGTLKGTES